MPAEAIAAEGSNLDRKNPAAKVDFEHMPPEQLVEDILAKERRIVELMEEIRGVLAEGERDDRAPDGVGAAADG